MIHHFELLFVPVLRKQYPTPRFVSGLLRRRQKNYTHLYIGECVKASWLVYRVCFIFCCCVQFFFLMISAFQFCFGRCGFLNDSPSAQRKYTNLLLCGFARTLLILETNGVGWMETDDTPTSRGETDFGGQWIWCTALGK